MRQRVGKVVTIARAEEIDVAGEETAEIYIGVDFGSGTEFDGVGGRRNELEGGMVLS